MVGLFAPAKVPEERLSKAAVARVMASEAIKATLNAQGIAPLSMDRIAFDDFVRREINRW